MTQDEINAVKKAAEKMRKQQSAQDEIINMARQAGFMMENSAAIQAAEIFANLVAAKEREACAKVAEHSFGVIGSTIALAIRARGEQA
jgi:hypothetical protein